MARMENNNTTTETAETTNSTPMSTIGAVNNHSERYILTDTETGKTFTGTIEDVKKKVCHIERDVFLAYHNRVIDCREEMEKSIAQTNRLANEISDLQHCMNELLRW